MSLKYAVGIEPILNIMTVVRHRMKSQKETNTLKEQPIEQLNWSGQLSFEKHTAMRAAMQYRTVDGRSLDLSPENEMGNSIPCFRNLCLVEV